MSLRNKKTDDSLLIKALSLVVLVYIVWGWFNPGILRWYYGLPIFVLFALAWYVHEYGEE